MAGTFADVWEIIKNGGPPVILVLSLGLIWINGDRKRLLDVVDAQAAALEAKSEKLEVMSERMLILMTELKAHFFSGR